MEEDIEINQVTERFYLFCHVCNAEANYICTEYQCRASPFICKQHSCKDKFHLDCVRIQELNAFINKLLKTRAKMPLSTKKCFQRLEEIYDQMITQLSQQRVQITQIEDTYCMPKFCKQAYQKLKNKEQIESHLVSKALQQIKQKEESINYESYVSLESIQRVWGHRKKEFQRIITNFRKFRYPQNVTYQSTIVKAPQEKDLTNMLEKKVKAFELLHRASQNQFSSIKFHEDCDYIPDTVSIILTEKNKIIGGYTPLMWEKSKISIFNADNSGKSFLFSLSNNKKHQLNMKQYAINNYQDQGPTFGGGFDLKISDKCDKSASSYSSFPSSYGNSAIRNQPNYLYQFCGVLQGNRFKVQQYQVYKVHWQ